ncbi:MAG: sensor histidine kinase [Coriobacteriales bacterium]|nr:sensor histidine kinase [Coriobacteriales bacterium]
MSEQPLASFTLRRYLQERLPALAAWSLCLVAIFGAAQVLGVTPWGAALLCLVVLITGFASLSWDYVRKRAYYHELQLAIQQLERVRHLSAFVDKPAFLEGSLSWEACERLAYLAGKEQAQASDTMAAYQHYVDTWIHEIKTPIAAARLMLARMRGPEATALRQELESIERYVEQALYCARSASLSNDYAIKEISLLELVREACKRNQNLLIASGAMPILDIAADLRAFSDPSWLIFILGQLLSNAAKYGASTIRLSARSVGSGGHGRVELEVADDGTGIAEEDMPRIFDQGFVGTNGRAQGSATGMGLYLCATLCQAMNVGIDAYSELGRGTRIVLALPANRERINLTKA